MRLPPISQDQANSSPSLQRLPGFQSLLHSGARDQQQPGVPPQPQRYINGQSPSLASAQTQPIHQQHHPGTMPRLQQQPRTLTPEHSPPSMKRSDSHPAKHQSSMEWAWSQHHNLLTPPRSHELKPSDSFNDQQDDSDALFKRKHSRHSSASSHPPLFGPSDSSAAPVKPEAQWSAKWNPMNDQYSPGSDSAPEGPLPKRPRLTALEPSTCTSIDDHIAVVKAEFMRRGVSPPPRSHYDLFTDFVSNLHTQAPISEPEYSVDYQFASMSPPLMANGLAKKKALPDQLSRTRRIQKRESTPPPSKTSASRGKRGSKSSATGQTGAERKAERAKSSKIIFDKDFSHYPDFTPPMSVALDPWKHAKISKEWDHAKSDAKLEALKEDPLHEQMADFEIELARALSLKCSQYLLVKRQIFCKFVEWLRKKTSGHPKPGNWNKTAAQEASNVDVNKTSKLFEFFQNTGLFNEEHYATHLQG